MTEQEGPRFPPRGRKLVWVQIADVIAARIEDGTYPPEARLPAELEFVAEPPPDERASYVRVQMELDQVNAPSGRNVDRYLLVTIRTPDQVPAKEAVSTGAGLGGWSTKFASCVNRPPFFRTMTSTTSPIEYELTRRSAGT